MMRIPCTVLIALTCLLAALPQRSLAEPLTTAFSYRGYIEEQGVPVDDQLELEFEVFDALENGASLAPPLTFGAVDVTGGEFTTALDFGDAPFVGSRVWLEVRARPAGSGEAFTTLAPRQELRSVPYATHAQFVGPDAVASAQIQDGSIQTADLEAGAVTPDKLSFTPGDITEVTAGDGLLGGAASGSAELALDRSVLPPVINGRCDSPEVLVGITAAGELHCEVPEVTASAVNPNAVVVAEATRTCEGTTCSAVIGCPRDHLALSGGWIRAGYYDTTPTESRPEGAFAWRVSAKADNPNAYWTEVSGSVTCVRFQ